jgi:DNA-binding MarR family transcriptional regulator
VTERDIAAENRELAYRLSNNLGRLLKEFGRDYENRVHALLNVRGHPDIRPSHSTVFANLGTGAVRVTELAQRAQVTQQAMGKMLKELERMGYIERAVDGADKRAREIRLTERGVQLVRDSQQALEEVHYYYQQKVGAEALAEMESQLRRAVGRLQLDYLPDSWTEGS